MIVVQHRAFPVLFLLIKRLFEVEIVLKQYFRLVTTILPLLYPNIGGHIEQTGDLRRGNNIVNADNTNVLKGSSHYQIIVEGELNESWSDWLGNVKLKKGNQEIDTSQTILLSEIPDQAALRGLLNRIWDLNLELISVNRQGKDYHGGNDES